MRLLTKYLLREFLVPASIALVTFTFLLLLQQLFYILDLFLNRGVGVGAILKLLILSVPILLPLSVPMSLLLGGLLCYNRISHDGELTALRSAGCSHLTTIWPNLLLGLLFSLGLIYFNLSLAPKARNSFENLRDAIVQKNPFALFSAKVMNHFGDYKIFVEKLDRKKKKLSGISIYKINPVGLPTRILAQEGEMDALGSGDFTITLFNGAIHQPDPEKEKEYLITKFNRFALRIAPQGTREARNFTPREMTYSEITKKLSEVRESGLNPAPWKTEIHLRTALAAAPTLFAGLGILLGIQLRKSGRAVGIGLSLIIILIYYSILLLLVPLASGGYGSALLLTWLPNFFVMATIFFLWKRHAKY